MKRSNFIVNMNIKQKLTAALVPVVLAFILTNSYIFFSMNSSLKSSIIQDNMRTLTKIQNDINTSMKYLNEESIKLLIHPDVDEYLKFSGTKEEEAMIKSRFLRVVTSNNTITGTMVRSIFIIKSPSNYSYYSSSWGLNTREIKSFVQNMTASQQNLRKSVYVNPTEEFFEKCGVLHYVYPVANSIKDVPGEGELMVINLNPSFLANIFSRYYYSHSIFYITDINGNLIYKMNDDSDAEILSNYRTGTLEAGYSQIGNGSDSVLNVSEKMENLGWTVSIQVPYQTAFSELNTYRAVFLFSSLLSLFISAVFISVASSSVVSRIREMNTVMSRVKQGNLSCKFPVKYRDEVSMLGSELNNMIDSIKYLRFDITEKELRQREAEIIALQTQINPHFLYNTLETIRMIAISNDDAQTGEIIRTLSELLRYTLSSDDGETLVTVRQELAHVQSYLNIQKLRFGDRFSVTIDVEERALSCKTVKLILQPLVENAFSHGIKTVERYGMIRISGQKEDGQLTLKVIDNGRGMTEQRLRELRKILAQPPFQVRATRMIGLPNVNNRIKLYYGARYGIHIESVPDEGTEVSVTLPASDDETKEGLPC